MSNWQREEIEHLKAELVLEKRLHQSEICAFQDTIEDYVQTIRNLKAIVDKSINSVGQASFDRAMTVEMAKERILALQKLCSEALFCIMTHHASDGIQDRVGQECHYCAKYPGLLDRLEEATEAAKEET